MGTNYFIDGKHVGKASGRGRKEYAFVWAMQPKEFIEIVLRHFHGPVTTSVEDCEVCEVLKAIHEAASEEFDSVGTEFS